MEDLKTLKNTSEWDLYEKSVDFANIFNLYDDSNRNYRFFNGDQWAGVKVDGVSPVQLNFIQTIVDYKVAVINLNNWGIVYSSDNFEDTEFKPIADKLCELLNQRAIKIWKRNNMDAKIMIVSYDSAINDEGIVYTYWDEQTKEIKNEVLDKVDIYYGNENSSNIQDQPYIIIRQRMPVINAKEMAKGLGISEEKINLIIADTDNTHNLGDDSIYEKDETCTIIIKMWKEKGTVHFSKATRLVQLIEDADTKLKRYPVAHFIWSDKKGSSRGEGVVRNLIPNQIETNRILLRRAVVSKSVAYPQRVANIDYIRNPSALNRVGSTIEVTGSPQSVNDVFSTTTPAQMSTDVSQLQTELIDRSRTLQNAGDLSTGSVNPEDASGKAILAVQNASHQTLNNQAKKLKDFVMNLALNWMDNITTYGDTMVLQEETNDAITGKNKVVNWKVDKNSIRKLKANVTIEVTPISSFDQYAQELALENLLKNGWFAPDKIDQLEIYAKSLPENSTMPKQKILDICKEVKEQQLYIQQLQAQTQMQINAAKQFVDVNTQDFNDNMSGLQNSSDYDNTNSIDAIKQDADRQAYEDAMARANKG